MKDLTKSELKVLCYVTKGYPDKKICYITNVTRHTVGAHIGSVMRKFGVHNRYAAAYFALKNNIIKLEDLDDIE